MSRNPMWHRDANGVDHPTRETLLAFIREQCGEQEKIRVSEHLLAGCASCHRLQAIFSQDSSALDHLNHMSRYLYYPELQSKQIWLHIQRGEPLTSAWTGKRKRKFQVQSPLQKTRQYAHRRSVRIISLPAAFALFLLFMTVVIALAYTFVSSGFHLALPWQSSNNFHFSSGPGTSDVAPHLTNTPANTVLATVVPSPVVTITTSPTPTATVTVVKGPAIDYCPPRDNWGQAIFICGYDFKAGDKVFLVVDLYGRNTPAIAGPFWVNKHHEFTGWFNYSCKNPPLAIYARDETSVPSSVISNTLTGIPVVGCNGATPTPTSRGQS